MRIYTNESYSSDVQMQNKLAHLNKSFSEDDAEKIQDIITKLHQLLSYLSPKRLDDADLLLPLKKIPKQKVITYRNTALEVLLPKYEAQLGNNFFFIAKTLLAFLNRNKTGTAKRIDLLSLNVNPVLCANHVLYAKKAELLYKISLNEKHPLFLVRDLKRKKDFVIPFSQVKEIISEWQISSVDKELLLQKLTPLYSKYLEDTSIKEEKQQLPTFQDVYTLFTIQHDSLTQAKKHTHLSHNLLLEEQNTFIPLTLTKGCIVMGGNEAGLFKINLLHGITFEEITPNGVFLISPAKMDSLIKMMKNQNTFDTLTDKIIPLVQALYNQAVQPVFKEFPLSKQIKIHTKPTGEKCIIVGIKQENHLLKMPQNMILLKRLSSGRSKE